MLLQFSYTLISEILGSQGEKGDMVPCRVIINPLQCSCLENPRDGGAWWAAVYGVAQSRTRLKRLSSSRVIITSEEENM